MPAPLRFFCWTLACQAVGFAAGSLCGDAFSAPWLPVLCHAAAAFMLSRLLALSPPWQLLNIALPLSVMALHHVTIPGWLMAWTAIILLLIYIPTFWTRVPFYPTSTQMYEAVLAELPADRPFTFIDLGCGFGSLLMYLARKRPEGLFVGVEIGPLPCLLAWLRALPFGRSLRIRGYNFWHLDLSSYDYVYAFLAPGPMPALWEKCKREMKPGSILLINSFPVPSEPQKIVTVKDRRETVLFVHKMGRT